MKTILLTALLIGSTFLSIAQTQLPNGDFESWGVISGCPEIDSLGGFISFDEMLNYDNGFCNTTQSIIKSSDTYSGDYALKMTGFQYLNLGISSNQLYIATDLSREGYGIPFTGRPTKLTGYYKFFRGGTDTVGITVTSYNSSVGIIFNGDITISSSISTYTKFEMDLNYDLTTLSNPDRLILYIYISNEDHQADASTVLYLDDLVFEYDTPTSTTNYTSTSPINVYAANKNINFSENVSDVQIVDMVDSQKIQEASTTKTLNAASLTTGMYIVTYKYNDAYYSKKVIVE